MDDTEVTTIGGSAVVLRMAAAIVGVAGVLGFVLGAVIIPQRLSGGQSIAHLGPISFRITPVTMTLYGVVMVGAGLLVGIALVRFVARRYDRAG